MTVSTSVRTANYTGTGTTGPFAFLFRIFVETDLLVTRYDSAGVPTVLALTTDYTVAGAGTANGSITLTATLDSSHSITIERVRPLTQETELRNQGPYFAATIEDALDNGVMVDQQLAAGVAAAVQIPKSVLSPVPEISGFAPSLYLRVNAAGTGVEAAASVVDSGNFIQSGTGAVTRTANAKMADRLSFRDFGIVGDGSTDATAAILATIAAARANGVSIIHADPGRYRVTAPITIPCGISIVGDSPGMSGGVNGAATGYPTFLKDFSGDLFTWTGADGVNSNPPSPGGGLERVRIVQMYGSAPTVSGSAVVVTGTDIDHRTVWWTAKDVLIEESGAAPWTWAFNIDGKTFTNGDLRIQDCSTHTTGTGALRINGCVGIQVTHCTFFDSSGWISVGDTNHCQDTHFVDVWAAANTSLTLDHVGRPVVIGGIYTAIAKTANMTGPGLIIPGLLINRPSPDSSGTMGTMSYQSTITDGLTAGAFVLEQAAAVRNGAYVGGIVAAGGASKALIGLDVNDIVRINPATDAKVAVGAMTDTSDMANGDVAVHGGVRLGPGLTAPMLRGGSGAPSNAVGKDGDWWLRTDTPGTVNQRLYVRSGGTYAGIV